MVQRLLRAVFVLLLCISGTCFAQQATPPAVIVSLASVDKLLGDIGYLTRTAGSPEVGAVITLMAGQYIEGLNTKQPAGAYISFDGPDAAAVVFVPVADFAAVTRKIEESLAELQDVGGGVKKLTLQREVFLKEQGGWVFASDQAGRLVNLPADPVQLLAGLPEKYDLGIRVNVQEIPAPLRQAAISEIREGFDRALQNQSDEEQRRLQKQFGGRAIEDLVRYIEETDQLTIGWGVDQEAQMTFLDFSVIAMTGTKLSEQIAHYADASTAFAGFLDPEAAASMHFITPLAAEDIHQTKMMLDALRKQSFEKIDQDEKLPNAEARAAAKEIVGNFLDIAVATVEDGKLNGGATLLLQPQSINFIAGGLVADGNAVEANLKRLVELAKETQDEVDVQVKFDVGRHQDIDLHTLRVPVPDDEEQARRILGEELVIYVGTGPRSAYIAFGNESLDLLKQAIDASATQANRKEWPMKMHVALAPVLAFAASVDDDPVLAQLAQSLQDDSGKDQITVTASIAPRELTYRLEVDAAVLELVGQAAKLQNARNRDPF